MTSGRPSYFDSSSIRSSVPPETSKHAPEVFQQLVARDVEEYGKLLQHGKP
jgi:hypothetical protein